jgi:glutathione S-transferase
LRANVAYDERRFPAIVHFMRMAPLGRHTTPVLEIATGLVDDSTLILEYADGFTSPERRLFPEGEDEVRALEARFDDQVGPPARRMAYAVLCHEPQLFSHFMCDGVSRVDAAIVKAGRPVIINMLKGAFGLGDRQRALDMTRGQLLRVFDDISERLSDGRRYLMGDRFTAADLTFASLAAPVIAPSGYGVPFPAELPASYLEATNELRAHPAAAFVQRMFHEERVALI